MLTDLTLLVLNAVASFITTLLLARFYMQWARVSFRNRKGLIGLSGAHRNYGGNRGSMSCRSRESCGRHQGTNNQSFTKPS